MSDEKKLLKRGRPVEIEPAALESILLKHKDKIFNIENNAVLSKSDPIWKVISEEIFQLNGITKSAAALHTHVTCRKIFSKGQSKINVQHPLDASVESGINDSTLSGTREDVYDIHFSSKEFNELIDEKAYRQKDPRKYATSRLYKILKPGVWQLATTKKLWNEHRIGCGFSFERGRVNTNNTVIVRESEEKSNRVQPDDNLNEDSLLEQIDDDDFQAGLNMYFAWAQRINNDVKNIICVEKEGDQPNAYLFLPLAKKLLTDCKEIPMWSCIVRDLFGYGRTPASSAIVESNFNDLKTRLFNKKNGWRIDYFVKTHLNYMNGSANLIIGEHEIDKELFQREKQDLTGDEVDKAPVNNYVSHDFQKQDLTNDEVDMALVNNYVPHDLPIGISECPACINGNFPGGAHICAVCSVSVHVLDGCSFPYADGEEGYGQRRLCKNCNGRKLTEIESIMSLKEKERWGGYDNEIQSKKQKKKSTYMRTDFLERDFMNNGKRSRNLILKNANSLDSKTFMIEGKKYSLLNTCAFDAITQVILNVARNDAVKVDFLCWNSNYSEFVKNLLDNGIRCNTYAKRGSILLDITTDARFITKCGSINVVNCATNAVELAEALNLQSSLGTYESLCRKCGQKLTSACPFLRINILNVKSRLNKAIEEALLLKKKICEKRKCAGEQSVKFKLTGTILFCEVYGASGHTIETSKKLQCRNECLTGEKKI